MIGAADMAALAKAGDLVADRELTKWAASGDFQAQRELLLLLLGDSDKLFQRSFADVARVELLARFCAMRGDLLDCRRLASVLWQMGRSAPTASDRRIFAAEAVGFMRDLADEGDGFANESMKALAADFPEEWGKAEMIASLIGFADRRKDLPTPPPIIITPPAIEQSLGDILAEAFGYEPRTGFLGLVDRVRFHLSELGWSIRGRWWALKDKLGWG